MDNIGKEYYNYFYHDISHIIIESILENEEVVLKEKQYSYLKDAIECVPHCSFLIAKAAQFRKANFCMLNEGQIKELMIDFPFFQNLTNYIMKKGNLSINEFCDVLLYCSFDYYESNEKYEHIPLKDEIILMGGLANECFIEEYITLKLLGYKNIEISEDYIYDVYENTKYLIFKKYIDIQEKEFHEIFKDTMDGSFQNKIYENL